MKKKAAQPQDQAVDKIPVTVLTGFLGSGKTVGRRTSCLSACVCRGWSRPSQL